MHRTVPTLIMGWDEDGNIGKPHGSNESIPVLAIFRGDGTLAHLHTGYDESELDDILVEINALVAAQSTANTRTSQTGTPVTPPQ